MLEEERERESSETSFNIHMGTGSSIVICWRQPVWFLRRVADLLFGLGRSAHSHPKPLSLVERTGVSHVVAFLA